MRKRKADLTTKDFVEIRALAGDDHGLYEDVYGEKGKSTPRTMTGAQHASIPRLRCGADARARRDSLHRLPPQQWRTLRRSLRQDGGWLAHQIAGVHEASHAELGGAAQLPDR